MVYDERILSWKGLDRASILTLKGRQIIPTQIGAYQETRLKRIRGQADLILRDNVFYLAVVVDAPEPVPFKATDFLGVDLGVDGKERRIRRVGRPTHTIRGAIGDRAIRSPFLVLKYERNGSPL